MSDERGLPCGPGDGLDDGEEISFSTSCGGVAGPSVDGKDTSLNEGDGVDGRGAQAVQGVQGVSCATADATLLVVV